jgi:hypothetical protein
MRLSNYFGYLIKRGLQRGAKSGTDSYGQVSPKGFLDQAWAWGKALKQEKATREGFGGELGCFL